MIRMGKSIRHIWANSFWSSYLLYFIERRFLGNSANKSSYQGSVNMSDMKLNCDISPGYSSARFDFFSGNVDCKDSEDKVIIKHAQIVYKNI